LFPPSIQSLSDGEKGKEENIKKENRWRGRGMEDNEEDEDG